MVGELTLESFEEEIDRVWGAVVVFKCPGNLVCTRRKRLGFVSERGGLNAVAGVEVERGSSSQVFRARVLMEEKAFTGKSGDRKPEWGWLGRGVGRRGSGTQLVEGEVGFQMCGWVCELPLRGIRIRAHFQHSGKT